MRFRNKYFVTSLVSRIFLLHTMMIKRKKDQLSNGSNQLIIIIFVKYIH